MDTPLRYAVTLPGEPGRHCPPEVVVVHATTEVTANGAPMYADAAGTFRVEIVGETARPLAEPVGQGRHTCLHAVPLPCSELGVLPRRSLDLLICASSRDSGGGRSPHFEVSSHEARENGRCV